MPWKRQDGKNQLQHERCKIINDEIKTGGQMPAGFVLVKIGTFTKIFPDKSTFWQAEYITIWKEF